MTCKPNLWIFSLEPIPTRYTEQWHNHIPNLLSDIDGYVIRQVDGIQHETDTTIGAFLNFVDTNHWKSSQLCKFIELHRDGVTTKDDHFLFTDAWNTSVLQLRYMSALMDYEWTFSGMWHAGSYDPHDILGAKIGSADWVKHTEMALFNSYDKNYFATKYHAKLFMDSYTALSPSSMVITGWPMGYLPEILGDFRHIKKEDVIIFPHRLAPEKQYDIFRDLAESMPEYEFVTCQDRALGKDEYHYQLARAKIVFSASLQETLGISVCAEGPLLGALPLAPNRLSYGEVLNELPELLYPSEWTESYDAYLLHKTDIMCKIKDVMQSYDKHRVRLDLVLPGMIKQFFNAGNLISVLSKDEHE